MKRIALIIPVLLLTIAGSLSGQTYGVKGGANVAMFNNSSATDAALYFHTGIYIRECLNPNKGRLYSRLHLVFFQPELTYSRQGASLTDNLGDEYWIKNDYVNLGLIFRYHPVRKLGVEFGPQVGYMVVSDLTDKWAGKKNRAGVSSAFKKMDYALCFGLVYNTGSFCDFSFRYNLGLNNIVKDNGGGSIRNGVFQVSMMIDLW